MKNKSIGVNAFLSSFQRLLNAIFPLITFPYISHTLSVEGVGKYNFSGSVVGYFILLAGLGINTYAVREGSRFREDRNKISEFASKVFTINLFSTIFSYMLLFVILVFVKKLHAYTYCILIFAIQIIFTTLGTEWIYTIFEEYAYITIRNIIFKIISIVLLFIFVRKPGDYLKYAIITVIANTGSYILNFLNCRKYCDIKITFNFNWYDLLKPIMVIFASNVAIQIYVSADTTMLGLMKNDYSVGIYGVSVKVYNIIANLLCGILVVTVPRLSSLMGQLKNKEYSRLLAKLIQSMYTMAMPCMIGLFFLSREVVLIIGGKKYIASTVSLQILCFALVFKIFSTIFNDCVLIPARRELYSMRNFIFAAILNITLNFWFIPMFGARGAAITTLLAEGITMGTNLFCGWDIIKKTVNKKSLFRSFISVLFGVTAISIICIISKKQIDNLIIRVVITVTMSIVVYFIILFKFKNSVVLNSLSVIKKKFRTIKLENDSIS